jgi:succinyl-diaminopimelate desuccinylase
MIEKFIEENKDNILKNICELIKIPSVSIESNNTEIPFGIECSNALNYVLNLASTMGFRTKNIDGYCGYIEFGEGSEILGIIGHLDVVPGGDGWTKCTPFNPIIENDKIYGRGAIDDKGPVIASLYAMKYVMDTMNVNKRVRLILGLNEEVSWKCIEYYKAHEELPTIGFSPDADFPCIYAEKGFLNTYVESSYIPFGDLKIESITCNNAINIVPKFAEAVIEISNSNILYDSIKTEIEKMVIDYNFHIDITKLENNKLKLTSTGVASHAAHPDLGINALSRLLILINDLLENHDIHIPFFKFVKEKLFTEFNGNLLNIDCSDESGELTLNVANIEFNNNQIILGLNLRIPVTIYPSIIKQKINDSTLEYSDISIKFDDEKPALYIPKTDSLVTTLCSVFNEVTGLNESPITCAGATYARAFKNVVSFGCTMPGKIDMCHKADEYAEIPDLLKSIEIFIKAIRKLATQYK